MHLKGPYVLCTIIQQAESALKLSFVLEKCLTTSQLFNISATLSNRAYNTVLVV